MLAEGSPGMLGPWLQHRGSPAEVIVKEPGHGKLA